MAFEEFKDYIFNGVNSAR